MKKKVIPFLSIAALLLSACGDNASDAESDTNTSDTTASEETENVEEATIDIAIWDSNQEPVLREILDNFEAENEDIKVQIQLTPFGQYWTKLEAAATGGDLADVVWMNGPNFELYAGNGIIEPLTSYLEDSDLNLDDYPDGLIDLYNFNGDQYGIPKDWDTSALWYNKELFDAAGVDYPTDDWTFEDMRAAAEEITDPDAGIYGVSANAMTQEGMYEHIIQNGGYIINEDSTESGYDKPEAIEAVEQQVALIEDGLSPDLGVQNDTSAFQLFGAEKLAMVQTASYRIPEFLSNENLEGKIDLVEVPAMKQKGTVIHGLAHVMSANSEYKDQAFRLIEYLGGEEANRVWAESGVVIPAYEDVLDIWIDSQPDLNYQAYVNSLEYAAPYPVSANTSRWNEYENEAIRDIFSGDVPVADALENLANQMNEALAAE